MSTPPRIATVFGPVALVCLLLLSGCGSAVFRPERIQPVSVPSADAAFSSLKVRADGQVLITTSWQAGDGVAVRDVQVAPLREAACSGDFLGRASVLRVGGSPRWERPLSMSGVSVLEVEVTNLDRALETNFGLDFGLATPAGPACVRLPFPASATRALTRVTTGALGVTLQTDEMGPSGFVRPGLWVGSYRHGVQVGFGDSRGVDGRRAVLPFGRMLALGWTTERLWSLPIGFYAVSLAVGYQARALIQAPAAGEPRIAHGPQLIVRPFTFVGVHAPELPVGGRLGYLSAMEITFAYWLSGDGQERAGTLGIGLTWDRPLTR